MLPAKVNHAVSKTARDSAAPSSPSTPTVERNLELEKQVENLKRQVRVLTTENRAHVHALAQAQAQAQAQARSKAQAPTSTPALYADEKKLICGQMYKRVTQGANAGMWILCKTHVKMLDFEERKFFANSVLSEVRVDLGPRGERVALWGGEPYERIKAGVHAGKLVQCFHEGMLLLEADAETETEGQPNGQGDEGSKVYVQWQILEEAPTFSI